jgi:hypothetical protein
MAFAAGALVPIAGIIASAATTANVPREVTSDAMSMLLIVMWCGMIAVSIAGLFSAAWLVKTAAGKLHPAAHQLSSGEQYPPPFIDEPALERQYQA